MVLILYPVLIVYILCSTMASHICRNLIGHHTISNAEIIDLGSSIMCFHLFYEQLCRRGLEASGLRPQRSACETIEVGRFTISLPLAISHSRSPSTISPQLPTRVLPLLLTISVSVSLPLLQCNPSTLAVAVSPNAHYPCPPHSPQDGGKPRISIPGGWGNPFPLVHLRFDSWRVEERLSPSFTSVSTPIDGKSLHLPLYTFVSTSTSSTYIYYFSVSQVNPEANKDRNAVLLSS